MRPWRRRGRRLLGLIFVSLLIMAFLSRERWLPGVAAHLDATDCREPVDFVMVLAGHARTRPLAAAALYRAGWADAVLISTAIPSADELDQISAPQHEITSRVLEHGGVPREALVHLPELVDSTFDEAGTLRDFLGTQTGVSVAVLTNSYHVRRARMIFRRVLGRKQAANVCFIGAPQPELTEQDWWHTRFGFNTYLREYAKLVYYWFRYW